METVKKSRKYVFFLQLFKDKIRWKEKIAARITMQVFCLKKYEKTRWISITTSICNNENCEIK